MSKKTAILPTSAQALVCFILCQRLTDMYRPIFHSASGRTHEIHIHFG
ncbi:DUF6888 family protein [Hydrococcus rivularis]